MSPRGLKQNEQMRNDALQKICIAALRVFAEFGYYGTTMKQITAQTGLSYGLVYHYFPSKAELFYHLVDFALTGSLAGMAATLEIEGTAWQKIENLSAMLVSSIFTEESSLYFQIIFQAMTQGKNIHGISERIRTGIDAYNKKLAPVIHEAQKDGMAVSGDAEVLSAAYLSFTQGIVTLVYQGQNMEKKITPDILSNILKKGAACNGK
jgi:AcrR family transcriptional regulator